MKCHCCGSEHSESSVIVKDSGWLMLCPSCAGMDDFKLACEAAEHIRKRDEQIKRMRNCGNCDNTGNQCPGAGTCTLQDYKYWGMKNENLDG